MRRVFVHTDSVNEACHSPVAAGGAPNLNPSDRHHTHAVCALTIRANRVPDPGRFAPGQFAATLDAAACVAVSVDGSEVARWRVTQSR